jgi:hypothetical protein
MEVKIRKDYRWNSFIAFSGVEFVKYEFRPVPKGYEDLALADERFEVRQEAVKELEQITEPFVVETVSEFEPPIVIDPYEPFEPIKKRRRHTKAEE